MAKALVDLISVYFTFDNYCLLKFLSLLRGRFLSSLIESVDMAKALVDLFLFILLSIIIAYPKPLYPVFLFLQHIVFGILDDQPQPNCVTILHTAMDKL